MVSYTNFPSMFSMDLSRNEVSILAELSRYPDKFISEDSLKLEGLDRRTVASAVSYLIKKGAVDFKLTEEESYDLGEEGRIYLSEGLPEQLALKIAGTGETTIDELKRLLGEEKAGIALNQLARSGIRPVNGSVQIDMEKLHQLQEEYEKRRLGLKEIEESGRCSDSTVMENLLKRKNLIIRKTRKIRHIRIRPEAISALKDQGDSIESLTQEMLSSGSWKGKSFRPYELNPETQIAGFNFLHPLSFMIEQIRDIFIEMGFTEMHGNYVETALWNMDALFIPQNHPARQLQDTFYLEEHPTIGEEDRLYQGIFKKVHESGIKGYSGWGSRWDPSESEKLLLRTHTTVNTIRYLVAHRTGQHAVFSVDRVFRHENMDWKHLPELHQIEGAVMHPKVSLGTLKWIIREFYSRLGIEDVKFIPSYYPYTEPSMDIVAEINSKEVELGGSGIFRPEVLRPLGIKGKVMAWGMGLERFAMLYYNLRDIREIYNSDIDWLKTYRITISTSDRKNKD